MDMEKKEKFNKYYCIMLRQTPEQKKQLEVFLRLPKDIY